jgi:hypothetical protein
MKKQPEPSHPHPKHPLPSKEMVRAWLAQRREQRQPPPSIDQVRAQLNWR